MWYDLITLQPLTFISPDERVIAYGDGFFTTMAVRQGNISWLTYHLRRVQDSCQQLQLSVDVAMIESQLRVYAQQLQEGMLKLIVCRQSQSVRGYGFENQLCHCWLKVMPMTIQPLEDNEIPIQPYGQAICLQQAIACLPPPLVGLKLLNAQDKVMASYELRQHQIHHPQIVEGLVKDVMGNWVEGTFCNVFYQLNHQAVWLTPPLNQSGVKGVMRQVLLERLSKDNSVNPYQVLTDDSLPHITSLFFCNAVRGIIPIDTLILANGDTLALSPPTIVYQS